MLTRVGLALVDVQFAPLTAVALWAVANELTNAVFATATVHAWVGFAFVDVAQTAGVKVTTRTITLETVDQVGTFPYKRKNPIQMSIT